VWKVACKKKAAWGKSLSGFFRLLVLSFPLHLIIYREAFSDCFRKPSKTPRNVNIGHYVTNYQKRHSFCGMAICLVDLGQLIKKNDGFNEKKTEKVLQFRKIVVPLHRI
jgi:hypothetical protein